MTRTTIRCGVVCGGSFDAEIEQYEQDGWRASSAEQLKNPSAPLTTAYCAAEHPLTQLDRHRTFMRRSKKNE